MSVNTRVYPVTVFIFLATVLYTVANSVYATDYEKSQTIGVLCSNLGSQTNGDENSVSVASAEQQEEDKSS